MSNRMWGLDFLSRRDSSRLGDDDSSDTRKSSHVQTLGSMRKKPGSTVSVGSSGDEEFAAADIYPAGRDQDKETAAHQIPKGAQAPHTPAVASTSNLLGSSDLSPSERAAEGAPTSFAVDATDNLASSNSDSRSSTPVRPDAAPGTFDQQQPAEPARLSHESVGSSSHYSTSTPASNFPSSARNSSEMSGGWYVQDQQQGSQLNSGHPNAMLAPAGAYAGPGTPHHALGFDMSRPQDLSPFVHSMAGNGMPGHMAAAGMGGSAAGDMLPPDLQALQMLLGDLQREAGLNEQQAATAAALMQRYTSMAKAAVTPATPATALNNQWPGTPPTGPAGVGSSAFPGAGAPTPSSLAAQAAAAANYGAHAAGGPVGVVQHSFGSAAGYDSQQSSGANNAQQSGSDGAGLGVGSSGSALLPGGFNSPEAVYGTDGLDVPGTAQVAVHNVPFKWCNADLEALFKQLPGYLDAQLLFHENGRSKGVGVALFTNAETACEACNRLTGVQADGRKLELVLMSPDNHISFSCKQVAVLGLPWEYTAADVRALIEAAAEADGVPAHEAGVEAVEVAYREDGKSEGRAIATFRSRAQAHFAITRLHGRETLAGLRMRLFYLHEQQQRQHLLAQIPQSLISSVGQLSLDAADTAAAALGATQGPAAPGSSSTSADVNAAAASRSRTADQQSTAGGEASAAEGADKKKDGDDGGASSGRSSFDKDQGPVILHVSGLMESVTREQLRELFSQAGEVTKVDIPDGGRSMGYGFITFSNPQAAEQAMLLFNNYPLSGGAIHVAYSTSATAKARQQALRQARKATLGAHAATGGSAGPGPRASFESGMFTGSGSRSGLGFSGLGATGLAGRRGGLSLDDPLGLGAMGGGADALPGIGAARRSFDLPSLSAANLPRSRAVSSVGSGLASGAYSAGGLGTAAVAGDHRRRSFGAAPGGFGAGLSMAQLQQLQLMQAAGVPGAAAAFAAAAAGASAPVPGPFNNLSLEQLMMQMGGGEPAAGLGPMGLGGAAPGTPPHPALGGGMFSGMPGGGAGLMGGLGTPNAATTAALLGSGSGGPVPGLFGGATTPQAGLLPGALGSMQRPAPGTEHMAALNNPLSPFGAAPPAAATGRTVMPSKHVAVTGLPLGLDEQQVLQLFQICGPVENFTKPGDNGISIVTYETIDGASKAVQILDGTSMPSGRTMTVQFAPIPQDLAPAGAADFSASAPFGSGFNIFSGADRTSDGTCAASSGISGWEGTNGTVAAPGALFGQGWGGTAERPPFGQGSEGMMDNTRASWDGGLGVSGRPPVPGGGAFSAGQGAPSGGRASGGFGPSPHPFRSASPVGNITPNGMSSAYASPAVGLPGMNAGQLPPVYTASPVPAFQGSMPGLFGAGNTSSFDASAALLGQSGLNANGLNFGAGAAISDALLSVGNASKGVPSAWGALSNVERAGLGVGERRASPAPALSSRSSDGGSAGRLAGLGEGQGRGFDGGAKSEGSA